MINTSRNPYDKCHTAWQIKQAREKNKNQESKFILNLGSTSMHCVIFISIQISRTIELKWMNRTIESISDTGTIIIIIIIGTT